jgi:hypothetical protein
MGRILGILATVAVALLVVAALPDIARYLKIKAM